MSQPLSPILPKSPPVGTIAHNRIERLRNSFLIQTAFPICSILDTKTPFTLPYSTSRYDGPIDGDASSCGTLALGEGVSQPGPRVKIGSTAAADAASGSASVGVIAGAVVGVVALIALITIVVVRVKRSRAATFSKVSPDSRS